MYVIVMKSKVSRAGHREGKVTHRLEPQRHSLQLSGATPLSQKAFTLLLRPCS